LLTTLTTVAGLLPMTLTESTLWPPMAWSIISGLSASTFLTLLVVPAMCTYLLRESETQPVLEQQG
jgi:multidrug efflux pump subunit AcrB